MTPALPPATYDEFPEVTSPWRGWQALIYVRISAADVRALRLSRRKGLTEAQKIEALTGKVREHLADCREYADSIGLAVQETFSELGSASIFGTKELAERARMLARLAGRPGPMVVLTTEVARLYRDADDAALLLKEARRRPGLVVLDTNDRAFNLSDGGAEDFRDAVNAAAREAAVDSHRRRRKERRRARAGGWWGTRPFGYSKDRDEDGHPTGSLTVIEADAALIRQAAGWLIGQDRSAPGVSPSAAHIARQWNAAGSVTTRGNPWTSGAVVRVLTHRRYLGIRVHQAAGPFGRKGWSPPPEEAKGQWEPILDEATHEAVVRILRHPGRRTNHTDSKLRFALSGLAVCGKCGHRMRAAPYAKGGERRRWVCPPKGDGGCAGVQRAMQPVEDWAVYVVGWWLREGGQYDDYLKVTREAGGQDRARARLAEVTAGLAGLAAEEDRLADQLAAAGFSDLSAKVAARLKVRRAALRAERENLEAQLRQSLPSGKPALVVPWDEMTATERRDWLRRFIDKVVIHPAVPGRHWFDLTRVEVVPGAWWPAGKPAEYPDAGDTRPPPRLCGLPDCPRPHEGHGLCEMHNARRLRAAARGRPDDWDRRPGRLPSGFRPGPPKTCGLPDCGGPHDGHGLCNLHNGRRRAAAKAGHPDDWDRTPARRRPGPAKGAGGRPRKTPNPRT